MAACRVKIRSEIEVDIETDRKCYDLDDLKKAINDDIGSRIFDDDLTDKAEIVQILNPEFDEAPEDVDDEDDNEESLP